MGHVDTAEGCSGLAKPNRPPQYAGQKIVLPDDPSQSISPDGHAPAERETREDLITASARRFSAPTTAGVVIVMAAVRHLRCTGDHPSAPCVSVSIPMRDRPRHGEINARRNWDADVAYHARWPRTGRSRLRILQRRRAVVKIAGVAAHPGWAKNVMFNAIRLARISWPRCRAMIAPECTSGDEGFVHPVEISGSPEAVEIRMILRDFELADSPPSAIGEIAANKFAPPNRAQYRCGIRQAIPQHALLARKGFPPPSNTHSKAVKRTGLTPFSDASAAAPTAPPDERGLPDANISPASTTSQPSRMGQFAGYVQGASPSSISSRSGRAR